MKRIPSFVFAMFLLIACAHPQVKENDGVREYGLTPAQQISIDKIELSFDNETILQIIALTDEQIERLKDILKELNFCVQVNQSMGDFNIDVGVQKEDSKQYDQDATQDIDVSPDIKVIP